MTSGRIYVPKTEPIIKNGSAISILPEPDPNVNSTPDPHPLASCIPKPNINAPNIREKLTGAILPTIFGFKSISGIKKTEHIAARRK
jgi:hypothetical protein